MMASEKPFPIRVMRASSTAAPRRVSTGATKSLASIEDRVSSTESAVDMMAATTPTTVRMDIQNIHSDSDAQPRSNAGNTWSAATPLSPLSRGSARMPTRKTGKVVRKGRKASTESALRSDAPLRAAKMRWMAWG